MAVQNIEAKYRTTAQVTAIGFGFYRITWTPNA